MGLTPAKPFQEILEKCVLSAEEAIPLMLQLLEQIKAIHARNQAHGELSSRTVTLNSAGRIEILPPTAVSADRAADLWAAGSLFYEMMTGQKVHPQKPIQYPIEALHWVPPALRDLIAELCAADPSHRLDAGEAYTDLIGVERKEVALEDLGGLARVCTNYPEVHFVLSRDANKLIVKRVFALALMKQAKLVVAPAEVTIPVDGIRAVLLQVRGEPVTLVKPEPITQRTAVRMAPVTPAKRGLPLMEVAFVALLLVGAWFILGGKYKIPFLSSKAAAPVAVAKPQPKPMPDNTSTSATSFWLPRGTGPLITWTNSVDGFDAFLHVSRSANFSMLAVESTVRGTEHRVNREIEEGHYFWRLYDRATGKSVGPFEFTLSYLQPPKILTPADQQTYSISATYTAVEMDASWECKPGVKAYEVTISDSNGAVVGSTKTADCMWHSVQLRSGQYALRLRVADPVGEMNIWSDPVIFWVRGGRADSLSKFRSQQQSQPVRRLPARQK
ncbi:MAG: hypothetical protein KF799_14730 [Bdellovibrionales bacterium]|nr:hypothetical protein [Bdellovibrionales bacterium]